MPERLARPRIQERRRLRQLRDDGREEPAKRPLAPASPTRGYWAGDVAGERGDRAAQRRRVQRTRSGRVSLHVAESVTFRSRFSAMDRLVYRGHCAARRYFAELDEVWSRYEMRLQRMVPA